MTIRLALAALVLSLAPHALAQTWDETTNGGGDAGQLPAGAQVIPHGTSPLTTITGSYTASDADMWVITICDPANFSAGTAETATSADTQMWLFRLDGTGIAFNDDWVGGSTLQSRIGNSLVGGLPAGRYLLAISGFDYDPRNPGALEMWADTPYRAERAPDGPGAAGPVASWGATGNAASYTITLSGVCFEQGVMFPSGTGTASPASVSNCGDQSVLLSVFVNPGFPNSPPFTVRADTSMFGGSSTQQLFDDGQHEDGAAGDLVYAFRQNVPFTTGAGQRTVPFSVTDALNRTGNGSINLTVTSCSVAGACCTAGACQILGPIACQSLGGTYLGTGTNCGAASYAITNGGGGAFEDISATGTPAATAGGCDDCVETGVPIGFNFSFFGNVFTTCNISSNGNIQFGGTSSVFTNTAIPSTAVPNNAIYPMWDDLNPGVAGDVYYQTLGTSPNQRFIVQWHNCTQFALTTSETFQAVLFEGSNNIEFRYAVITPETPAGDYTVGVENADGTVAHSVPGSTIGSNTNVRVTYTLGQNPCAGLCFYDACPWSGDCCPFDFNGSGGTPDDADIAAFFSAWNNGAECADVNLSEGTPDDADIAAFFTGWNAGGC